VRSVFVTVSGRRYPVPLIASREEWDALNESVITSDIPQAAFVFAGQLGLWPTPVTSANVISVNAKVRVVDLAVADLTSQSVSITNGGTTVTGSGTTWRRGLAGFYIRVAPNSSSDTTSGDGQWYEISSVVSTTSLTLVRAYNGPTVAAGVALIGQMPLLPDSFHDMPWHAAAATYWAKETDARALYHEEKRKELLALLIAGWSNPTTSLVLDSGEDFEPIDPNLTISL
jgi:hypothetical protein